MKKRRAGLVVALLSLYAFNVASAEIEFGGVLDPLAFVVQMDSVKFMPQDTVFLTPGWGSHPPMDTFIFTGVTVWPETLRIYGTVDSLPASVWIRNPLPDTWYHIGLSPTSPMVMFWGDYNGIEESKPVAAPLPRLTVSPSVVTGQMTVKLEPVGNGRQVVEIHDAVGNVVRSLDCTTVTDGVATAIWNREDEFGRLVPDGVYFCRHVGAGVTAVRKFLVAH
jgi:hypothetical protein